MLKKFVLLLVVVVLGGCFFSSQQQAKLTPEVDTLPAVQLPVVEESPVSLVPQDSVVPSTPAEVVLSAPSAELELPALFVEDEIVPAPLPYFDDFPLSSHPRVDKIYNYYTGNGRKSFGRWLERAGRYMPMIQQVFADEGVPQDLAYLAMIESGFNVKAYSWAHAAGPWQFIESTAKLYDMKNDWWQDQRCDIEKATHAAAKHLKYLSKRFDLFESLVKESPQ